MKLGNPLRFVRPFSGLVQPDLVTVLVEPENGGTWGASFIGDGRLPSNSGAYSDMDELVSAHGETTRVEQRWPPLARFIKNAGRWGNGPLNGGGGNVETTPISVPSLGALYQPRHRAIT